MKSHYIVITVIYFLLNYFDFFIISRYMGRLYGKPNKRKLYKAAKWITILIPTFLFAPYTALWGISISSIIMLYFYPTNRQKKITFHFAMFALASTSLFCSFSFGESLSLNDNYMGLAIIFLPHLIFMIFCEIACKVCGTSNMKLPLRIWIPVLLIPFASILGVLCTLNLANSSNLSVADVNAIQFPMQMIFLSVNIIVFYIFGKLSDLIQEKEDKALFEQQLYLQKQYYQRLIEAHKQIRSIHHDMKNHLETISFLAVQHSDDKIINYLQELGNQVSITEQLICTGNSEIDAIINMKMAEAHQKGIETALNILIPQNIGLKFSESVILLGNIFDNAMEACLQADTTSKKITLKMQYLDTMLFLELKNSLGEKALNKQNIIASEKSDTDFHGLGLKNIQRIVDIYNGTMRLYIEDQTFVTKIILYGVQPNCNKQTH